MGSVETDERKTQATKHGNVSKNVTNKALKERVGKQQVQRLERMGRREAKQLLTLLIQLSIQIVCVCPAARNYIFGSINFVINNFEARVCKSLQLSQLLKLGCANPSQCHQPSILKVGCASPYNCQQF